MYRGPAGDGRTCGWGRCRGWVGDEATDMGGDGGGGGGVFVEEALLEVVGGVVGVEWCLGGEGGEPGFEGGSPAVWRRSRVAARAPAGVVGEVGVDAVGEVVPPVGGCGCGGWPVGGVVEPVAGVAGGVGLPGGAGGEDGVEGEQVVVGADGGGQVGAVLGPAPGGSAPMMSAAARTAWWRASTSCRCPAQAAMRVSMRARASGVAVASASCRAAGPWLCSRLAGSASAGRRIRCGSSPRAASCQ